MNYSWLLKMAWRDSRKNKKRLALFMSSIILGIAALVAINSFGENMKDQINSEAKELLGADLEVESRDPISDEIRHFFDSLQMQSADEVSFASMVYFPKSKGTRLVNIRAMDGRYPFYGEVETSPRAAAQDFISGNKALVDRTLLLQFDAEVGDGIKIGELLFTVEGQLIKVPGQTQISSGIAPPVFIPLNLLDSTGLIQMGSRVNYKLYLKYPDNFDPTTFKEVIEPRLEKEDFRFDDVAERKEELGDAYSDLTAFLNLTAFIALLLGCIGVASSVHVYMKDKVKSVAILRCLGAQAKHGFGIYLTQLLFMGLIGSIFGSVLGSIMQFLLPVLLADFVPFSIDLSFDWGSVIQGILLGVVISVLFALIPLIRIRKISPLKALRESYENPDPDQTPYIVYGVILLFIYLFSFFQLDDALDALVFTASLLFAALLLWGIAEAVVYLVRKFFPARASFIWRQGLANLYRPNNQTNVLIVTIGLGTALIATLLLSQDVLLNKVKFSSQAEDQPNMVLFDIQSSQMDSISSTTLQHGLKIIRKVPIVSMKLHELKGIDVELLKKDTNDNIKNWVLKREYRVTYRDSLKDAESLIEGRWYGKLNNAGDSIFVSLDEGLVEDMDVEIGDAISFNVQGAIIEAYVGSIRKIDWQRVQTNFLVVFPEGVLEKAPKFHVILARFDSIAQSAKFQQAVVKKYPNVSIVDLNLILNTLDEVLEKVSFVIRFMAFISIITGLLVLIGSVVISKYQRIQESVLLRTLGASRRQILRINLVEYFILGSLSALTGALMAVFCSWALAIFSFDTLFVPDFWPLLVIYTCITVLTVVIGLSNSREVLNKPPLAVIRS